MNRLLSVVLIAVAASLFLAAAPVTSVSATASIDLSIEIAPTSYGPYELLREQHRGTFTCCAMWLDEPNHRIYGSVSVVVHPGEEQTETSIAGGVKMTMKGRVDSGRTGATAEVTVVRDGVLIAHQQSRVKLTGSGRSQVY
ncbi:MAG TPA: hypothetical protein VGQ21_08225 [Thermoanaerobaculia bacterium]|jgi:hypothetical protein|nr:hypothetical protein [Thermoanaerobaculia bacterium]